MNIKHNVLIGRIRLINAWEHASRTGDELYIDSVALNLHSFYTALERIFELIAISIDREKPQGEYWHLELLRQMSTKLI